MIKKNFLITGGSGFIGRAISESLIDLGCKVVVIDNNFRNKNKFKNKNLTIHNVDIRNKFNLKKFSKNIDAVIHLAAINGTKYFYEKPELVLDVGIKGIINIIDVCKENNIKEIYLASTSEVYQDPPFFPTNEKVRMIIPDPHNPRFSYSASKIISEILLLNSTYFRKVIIFRPHNIYGPNMGYEHAIPEIIMKSIKAKTSIKLQGNGKNKRSFCYIDDFVNGLNLILKKGKHKEIYNIGSTYEINIIDITKKILKILNKDLDIKVSNKTFYNASRRLPDLSKLRKIGYKPIINLNMGLIKTIEWYKEQV